MSQQASMGVRIPCLVIRAVAGPTCCDSSLHGAHFILSTVQPAAVPPVVLLNSLSSLHESLGCEVRREDERSPISFLILIFIV